MEIELYAVIRDNTVLSTRVSHVGAIQVSLFPTYQDAFDWMVYYKIRNAEIRKVKTTMERV